MARPVREELIPFLELNEAEKEAGKKVPWKERYALIKDHFPASVVFDWRRSFRDVELWGKVWKDIYDSDQRDDPTDNSRERLRQLMGEDYSYDAFLPTFELLAGTRSLRHLARKLDVSYGMIRRIRNGTKAVDLELIERTARAFGKDPSYFVEWRIAYILGSLGDQLELSPETSVDVFRRITKRKVQW